jgi:serine/threonine-protein kinase HipA
MSRAYIYVEDPETGEVHTLGRLSIENGQGEFIYDPDYVAGHVWVPDPIRYPLRVQPFVGITANRGVPGFINDAMPDSWGERVLRDLHRTDLSPVGYFE